MDESVISNNIYGPVTEAVSALLVVMLTATYIIEKTGLSEPLIIAGVVCDPVTSTKCLKRCFHISIRI